MKTPQITSRLQAGRENPVLGLFLHTLSFDLNEKLINSLILSAHAGC